MAALKESELGDAMPPIPQFLMATAGSPRTAALKQICKEGLLAQETPQQVSLVRHDPLQTLIPITSGRPVLPLALAILSLSTLWDFMGMRGGRALGLRLYIEDVRFRV